MVVYGSQLVELTTIRVPLNPTEADLRELGKEYIRRVHMSPFAKIRIEGGAPDAFRRLNSDDVVDPLVAFVKTARNLHTAAMPPWAEALAAQFDALDRRVDSMHGVNDTLPTRNDSDEIVESLAPPVEVAASSDHPASANMPPWAAALGAQATRLSAKIAALDNVQGGHQVGRDC